MFLGLEAIELCEVGGVAHDRPRLGAFNGLTKGLSEHHERLRSTDLAIREPRPTKYGGPLLAPNPHSPSRSFVLPRWWALCLVQSTEHHLDSGVEAMLSRVQRHGSMAAAEGIDEDDAFEHVD